MTTIKDKPDETNYVKQKKPKQVAKNATYTPEYYQQYLILHKKRKKEEE